MSASSSPPLAQSNRQIQVLILAFASFILIGLPSSLLGVAWPSIQATFGKPLDAMGIILITSTISYTIFSSLTSQLVSRLGFYRLMLITSGLILVGMLGQSYAPAWAVLLFAVFITGIGLSIVDAGMNMLVAAGYGAGVMNWLHASFGVGATLGPLLMTAVLQNGLPWQAGYRIVGLLQIPFALAVFLTRDQWRAAQAVGAHPEQGKPAKVSLVSTLALAAVWLNLLIFFLYTGFEMTGGQWPYSMMTLSRDIDPTTAGFWTSFYWGSLTAGRALLGLIVDRVGVVRMVRVSILISIAGALLFWWNPLPGIAALGLGLMGFGQAPIFPSMISLTPRLVGGRHAANAISLQVGVASVGVAVWPGIAGVLGRSYGLETIAPFLVAMPVVIFVVFEVLIAAGRRNGDMPAGA